jgi:outer membrane protein OmpA-like peptidoglycan-associated protein
MYTLASANKQNKNSSAIKQNNNNGAFTVQRKSNGQDTESLSRLISRSTPINAYHFSSRANLNLQSKPLSHFVQNSPIQAKLKVGQPNDKYEQEADRVADQVMSMPEPFVQRQGEQEEEEIQTKVLAEQITPLVQRQPIEEEEVLQTKDAIGSTHKVTQDIEYRIQSLKGGGQPLPESARSYFEPRFGYNFRNVRLHTNAEAGKISKALNAQALTIGSNILFRNGQYSLETSARGKLMAHELAHVVQQAQGVKSTQRQVEGHTDECEERGPAVREIDEDNPTSGLPPLVWNAPKWLEKKRQKRPAVGYAQQLLNLFLERWLNVHCIAYADIDRIEQLRSQLQDPERLKVDCWFGNNTEHATKMFQICRGLKVDGKIGERTWHELEEIGTWPKVHPLPICPSDVDGHMKSVSFVPASGSRLVNIGGFLCQVGTPQRRHQTPPKTCNNTPIYSVFVKKHDATFALCKFFDYSRAYNRAISMPCNKPPSSPYRDKVGRVKMHTVGLFFIAYIGYSIPSKSKEDNWECGFIQTVRSLKYEAKYQRNWKSIRQVSRPTRDAHEGAKSPWIHKEAESLPSGTEIRHTTPIVVLTQETWLGPVKIGEGPVALKDDPLVVVVDMEPNEPRNRYQACPCSKIESITANGTIDSWLIVRHKQDPLMVQELVFLQHITTCFNLTAKPTAWDIQGTPSIIKESGKGSQNPDLSNARANNELKKKRLIIGMGCPVTIKGLKCPIEPCL